MSLRRRVGVALLATVFLATHARAATPNLAGKTVQLIVGSAAGGLFDVWARAVAPIIGRYLPGNPTAVVQNMPGAGSFVATNYIYNVAPRDGTVIGLIESSAALGPINGATGARFDPTKISWLGTTTTETHVCVAYNSPGLKVNSLKDLYSNQLMVGATDVTANNGAIPRVLNTLLGVKFKIIAGFPSPPDIFLAMERGEIDGVCLDLSAINGLRPHWIESRKLIALLQGGGEPALKGVPFVNDLARTPEDSQAMDYLYASMSIGRPFVAPPNLSPETFKMLRDAFDATMKDREFLANAAAQNLDVAPRDGAYLEGIVKRIYATPKPIVDKIVSLSK
ncbi:MAG TPA: hypothetical protein VG271_04630 [Beijerinckiaceae bacterium]|jgi:tripartite-type tricarboxylate transporter receptor subunit TctC|nr:hypothetical protein [Beijerinckiaceae bacterium]